MKITTLLLVTIVFLSGTPMRAESPIVKRDIPYASSADPKQVLDIYAPPNAKKLPVMFWIHTTAQAQRLHQVLTDAGLSSKIVGARNTHHSKLNDDLGLPDDPSTKILFTFIADVLKK